MNKNKRIMRASIAMSRVFIGAGIAAVTLWLVKNALETTHSTEVFLTTLIFATAMIILSWIADAVTARCESIEEHRRIKEHIAVQQDEIRKKNNRIKMNINV